MNPFVKSLLTARETLLSDFARQSAQVEKQLGQLDALIAQYDVVPPATPTLKSAAPISPATPAAPVKRRGRPVGSTNKTSAAPASAKAVKKSKSSEKKSFNTTKAVRDIVNDMKKAFSVADVRAEFDKRHPGVLETINRVALSLALQSLGRRGEITAKKNPDGKGNIFQKATK